MIDRIQSVSILYEHGVPGVRFNYESGNNRTLTENEAIRFVQLLESEHDSADIDFPDGGSLRQYVATKYFS